MSLCGCGCGLNAHDGRSFLVGHTGSKRGQSLLDRFWSKVHETSTCWIWMAGKDNHGYGQFNLWREYKTCKPIKAYRMAYELIRATEVPAGMTLDHLCRNRACVNPDHLEVVTRGENVRRGHRWQRQPFEGDDAKGI